MAGGVKWFNEKKGYGLSRRMKEEISLSITAA